MLFPNSASWVLMAPVTLLIENNRLFLTGLLSSQSLSSLFLQFGRCNWLRFNFNSTGYLYSARLSVSSSADLFSRMYDVIVV